VQKLAAAVRSIGGALLLVSLAALWKPYDVNWQAVVAGVGLVIVGAMISDYE